MSQLRWGMRSRCLVVTALVLSVLGVTIGDRPAVAGIDGPPVLGEAPSVPQVHRPAGGSAVRIYGEGFLGTTSVRFGLGTNPAAYVAAPDFRVVDGDLIIATVPAAPAGVLSGQNDGFAHIRITDDDGVGSTDLNGNGLVEAQDCLGNKPGDPCFEHGAEQAAIFYTDATLTISPSTGLDHGESVTMTLTGHRPNQGGWPMVQLNPLVNFLEDGPVDADVVPPGPPYGAPLAFVPTNASGNGVATVTVAASPTFNSKDQDYDADADCPVAQITADHGLGRCLLGYSEFGMASLERQFSYSPDLPSLDPVPGAPTLTLGSGTGAPGATITVGGTRWNAAPHFGSDTTPNDPGESTLTIELCNAAQTACVPAGAPAANVAVTRYFDGGPDPDIQPVTPVYTGATLSGTFAIANTGGCAPSCTVRVRQQRYDIDTNAPVPGSFITATAPLTVTPRRAVADFDGNGTTDRSVYKDGGWFVHNQPSVFFGLASDIPVPADYDGNGTTDRAVYRDGAWYVHNQATVFFGLAGDVPVPGDYDGNGDAERAVYRPSVGAWYVDGMAPVFFGGATDVPVPGDYDGDGDTDRAVFRDGAWYVEGQAPVFLGLAGHVPVPGDYDGDGDTDRATYKDGGWYVHNQATVFFGLPGYIPQPGDYDGNGTTDRAVYKDGAWYVQNQATAFVGLAGYVPLPLPQAIYRRFF